MFDYEYKAADARGQVVSARLNAPNLAAAQHALAAQGLRVFSLNQLDAAGLRPAPVVASRAASTFGGAAVVSLQERTWLLDELATLLEAGVPLADAVLSLQAAHARGALGPVLDAVQRQLRSGMAFSQALAQPDIALGLPRYALALVAAGEVTGRLAASCRAAASQLAADEAFSREVRTALVYPAVLLLSGALAMLVVFVFVVPKFANLLDNPKAQLPLISQWVLKSGLWTTQHGWGLAIGGAVATLAVVWLARQAAVRQWCWALMAGAPILGAWVRQAELYRWASMMAVLVENKVNLLQALAQAHLALRSTQMAQAAQAASDAVRQGQTLSQALAAQQLMDAPALALVQTGEKSGALGKTLGSLAKRYEQASRARIARALVLIEPVMILLISVVLGGIMISVILAVTSLTNVI